MFFMQISHLKFSILQEINEALLENAETKITFWGTRTIAVRGHGALSLNDISFDFHRIARNRFLKQDLTPRERITGVEIARKIDKFYQLSDEQVKSCRFITRFFLWIREFFPLKSGLLACDAAKSYFLAFSKDNFIANFGHHDPYYEHPAFNGAMSSDFLGVLVKEEKIKELISHS